MRKALIAVLGAGVVMLVAAGVSTATHTYDGNAESVAVVYKGDTGAAPGGNVDCPANTIVGPKIDPGGNYSDANLTVSNYDGQTFDWAFTSSGIHAFDMALVIVKGRARVSRLHVRLRVDRARRQRQWAGRADESEEREGLRDQPHPVLLRPEGGRRQLTP